VVVHSQLDTRWDVCNGFNKDTPTRVLETFTVWFARVVDVASQVTKAAAIEDGVLIENEKKRMRCLG
jgi:hypothetical protein